VFQKGKLKAQKLVLIIEGDLVYKGSRELYASVGDFVDEHLFT